MLSLLLVVAPDVSPKRNVLVVDMAAVMLDVPVNVKFVAAVIDNTVWPAFGFIKVIPPVPNAIALVLPLFDEKTPVLMVKLFKSSVPCVSVVAFDIPVVKASCKVVVMPDPSTVNAFIVLPVDVSVPVPTVVKLVDVYVPPEASVNPWQLIV